MESSVLEVTAVDEVGGSMSEARARGALPRLQGPASERTLEGGLSGTQRGTRACSPSQCHSLYSTTGSLAWLSFLE